MKINIKNLDELAERYVNKEMPLSEWMEIQSELEQDSQLALHWQESISFINTLKSAGDHARTREMIADVMNKSRSDQEKYNNDNHSFIVPQNSKVVSFRKYLKFSSVAAAIALIASVITFFIATETSRKNSNTQFTQLVGEINAIKKSQQQQNIKPSSKPASEQQPAADVPMQGNYIGSGFAVTNDGYVATDYHVVKDADSVFIQTNTGKYYKAFVVSFDPNADVALLKIENNNFRFNKSSNTLPYSFAKKRADMAQQIFSIGYPSDDPAYNEGYISAQKGYEGDSMSYRLVITANPGQSGAPVFDNNGNVVALITAKQTNATYAIHSDALVRLIQSLPPANKITLPSANSLSKLSRTEQVKKAMDYVCAVRVYK